MTDKAGFMETSFLPAWSSVIFASLNKTTSIPAFTVFSAQMRAVSGWVALPDAGAEEADDADGAAIAPPAATPPLAIINAMNNANALSRNNLPSTPAVA